jgi:aspartate 1-decarboxylase
VIELNGATAHLGKIGDRLTIMSYGHYSQVEADDATPAVILLDENNAILRESGTAAC